MKWKRVLPVIFVLLLITTSLGLSSSANAASLNKKADNHLYGNPQYMVMTNASWLGKYGDYYNYNGTFSRPTDGFVIFDVDDHSNDGYLIAQVKNNSDTVTIMFTNFTQNETWQNGGVETNIWLHGTTGHGSSDFPKVYAYIAGWGTADVYINDTLVYDDFIAEFMYIRGIRNDNTKEVNNTAGAIFDPTNPDDVYTYIDDRELHLILHSSQSDTNNTPPYTEVLYLYFEDVDEDHTAIATNAHKIGIATDFVDYDGQFVYNVGGYTIVDVNASTNTGFIITQIIDGATLYTVLFTNFTGYDGGIAENITVFGNTNLSITEYPNVKAYLVALGSANIYRNGTLLFKSLNATVAITQGFRNDLTHSIYNATETGYFSASTPENVSIDPFDAELHVILHSNYNDSSKIPPYSVVYNYMFEEISMLSESYQLQQLKDQVNSLLARVNSLTTRLEQLNLNNTALYNQLQNVTTELEELKNEFNSLNETKTELEQRVEELRTQVDDLEVQVDELEQKVLEQRDNFITGLFIGIFSGALGAIGLMFVLTKYMPSTKKE